jgi:hypothetical protein
MAEYYSLTEILEYGAVDEVYEVVESPVDVFIGKQYVVIETKRNEIKTIRELTPHFDKNDDSDEGIPKLWGGLVAARFKLVSKYIGYRKIEVHEAVKHLLEGDKSVYVEIGGRLESIDCYTNFEDIGAVDFDDLGTLDFYVKL